MHTLRIVTYSVQTCDLLEYRCSGLDKGWSADKGAHRLLVLFNLLALHCSHVLLHLSIIA